MAADAKRNSLVYKFSFQIAWIVFLLLAVLVASNVYSFHVLESNVEKNAKYTMSVHINNIGHNLKSVTKDLTEIFENSMDSAFFYTDASEYGKYFETMRLKDSLITKMNNNSNIDVLFISDPVAGLTLAEFNGRILINEKLSLYKEVKSGSFQAKYISGTQWSVIHLNGIFYLFKGFKSSGMLFGALVKCDQLISSVMRNSDTVNEYILTDPSGRILAATSPTLLELKLPPVISDEMHHLGDRYYISERIPEFGHLYNMIERKNVFSGLAFIQWMIIMLGFISILVVPLALYRLSREIIVPVLTLVRANKEVEKGNWDYRVPENHTSLEFTKLYQSFTSMIKEIKALKIQSYEEKLERNKAELKYLQMQIKPHFFLNAITTISSLTYQNKNEDIRKLIESLSKYLRYMFKGGLVRVKLHEELDHVYNYIQLQEMKFPNQIFYMVDADPKLENQLLPQFIIQTFVENIFKHAVTLGELLSIFIKIQKIVLHGEAYVHISIEDNGEGFPQEMIARVNAETISENASGHQIGIDNIKRTLQLLYKKNGLLTISNTGASGAKVEIRIPLN